MGTRSLLSPCIRWLFCHRGGFVPGGWECPREEDDVGVHAQLKYPRGFAGPCLASCPLHPKGGHPSMVHVVLGTSVLRPWTKLQECQGAGLWHKSFLCFFLFFFFFFSSSLILPSSRFHSMRWNVAEQTKMEVVAMLTGLIP